MHIQHASIPENEAQVAKTYLRGTCTPTPVADPDMQVLSVMIWDRIDASFLDACPALQAIITRSDGYDHLPLEAMQARGIDAYHLEGYATPSVAEVTIGLILSLIHKFPQAGATTRAGRWDRQDLVGRTLADTRIGLLGSGRIGTATGRLLQRMGGQVHAYDVAPHPGLEHVDSLDTLLATSDLLSIHVPSTPATRGLIDAQAIAKMPAGALLVNTSRGDVVDQDAVAAALDSGRLAGYAADVLPGEPTPNLDSWRDRPNVLVTPHVGAHNHATHAARYQITQTIADGVVAGDAAVQRYRV